MENKTPKCPSCNPASADTLMPNPPGAETEILAFYLHAGFLLAGFFIGGSIAGSAATASRLAPSASS